MFPTLLTCIPFATDLNLGAAYNAVMAGLPEGGWACLLDHDVMFTTSQWHSQLLEAIARYPQGTFVARANRVGPRGDRVGWQRVQDVSPLVHNIIVHREIGARLARNSAIHDVTYAPKPAAGFLMCLSKETWQVIGGFRDGLSCVDTALTLDLRTAGRSIYVIEGLYLYHWRRGDGAKSPKGVVAITEAEWQMLKDEVHPAQETA